MNFSFFIIFTFPFLWRVFYQFKCFEYIWRASLEVVSKGNFRKGGKKDKYSNSCKNEFIFQNFENKQDLGGDRDTNEQFINMRNESKWNNKQS